MNYELIYDSLIKFAKSRLMSNDVYYEKHHIIPRHINGSDTESNLVRLTFKEHIVAHHLLWKIHGRTEDFVAFKMMKGVISSDVRQSYCSLGGKTCVRNNRESKSGPYFDKKLLKEIRKKGGHIQGNNNAKIPGFMSAISAKSKRMTGKYHITNGVDTKIVDDITNIPDGWRRGKYVKKTFGKIGITNGTENRRIDPSEDIPDGWYKGWLSKPMDKKWITDGISNKMISLTEEVPEGWKYGQTKKARSAIS